VHPPEPDPKVIARQMASIFSIPGIVQRGVRRRDEESYFRAVKYEEGGDLLNALKYYNLSASTGVESAIYKLGYFYDLGILVPMDKKKAFDLYSSAAPLLIRIP
jgi:TPR repeat protein